jgi:hypothetical protein
MENNMELFERYLQAVKRYLPGERQDDIVAELRANLEAQREEREAALGRPLTEGEMIDWLKELGPPMQMASRYQAPRYVIGPTVFPMYWYILRLAALWASVAYAIAATVRTIVETHPPEWIAQQVLAYPGFLIVVAAWVTGAFAVLELVSERYPEKCPAIFAAGPQWSPTSLPPLEKEHAGKGKPRSLTTAVAEFLVEIVLLAWLVLIPSHPYVLLGPGAAFLEHSPVRLAPVAVTFFWAVVGFNVIQIALHGYRLLSGSWRTKRVIQPLVMKALGIIPVAILVVAPGHRYLELNPSEAARLPAGFDFDKLNQALFTGVEVLVFIVALGFAWDLWKAMRKENREHFQAFV